MQCVFSYYIQTAAAPRFPSAPDKSVEKAGVAEQKPVKEKDIINFQSIEQDQISRKETAEGESIPDSIPRAKKNFPGKKKHRKNSKHPSQNMRTRNRSFLSGITARFSFGAEEKNLLF